MKSLKYQAIISTCEKALLCCTIWSFAITLHAQDFRFSIVINAEKVAARIDTRIIKNLESYLNTIINLKKWSNEPVDKKKFIPGSLLLTIEGVSGSTFNGSLIIQAERQVYNTSYYSTLFNHKDNDIQFQFALNQIDNFNENTVLSSSNPLRSNLPAILAFYAYLILGIDYDSQKLHQGNRYLNRALNIATNANASSNIAGWQPYANQNNRYELIKELTTSKYQKLHTAFYNYYRKGMDQLYDRKEVAFSGIKSALVALEEMKNSIPNSLQLYSFMQAHKIEIKDIISMVSDKKIKKELSRLAKKLTP